MTTESDNNHASTKTVVMPSYENHTLNAMKLMRELALASSNTDGGPKL